MMWIESKHKEARADSLFYYLIHMRTVSSNEREKLHLYVTAFPLVPTILETTDSPSRSHNGRQFACFRALQEVW